MARAKRHYLPGHITNYVGDGEKVRQEEWTDSVAAGSRSFVEEVKALLGYGLRGEKS